MAGPEPIDDRETGSARLLGAELVAGLVVAVLAGGLFGWLGEEVLEGDTQALDDRLRTLVNHHATPTLTEIMRLASIWGAPGRLSIVGTLVALVVMARGRSRPAVLIGITMLGAGLIDLSLKLLYGRGRPTGFFADYPTPSSYSFPSGHMLFATTFFGGLAVLLWPRLRHPAARVLVCLAALALVLLIGFSRIYLGVHYPSDVLGGFAAGAVWVGAIAVGDRLASHWRRRRR
jgi:membrane-associated phospholipid phosphatase